MVLLPSQFLTRKLLDDCFEAAGAEPLVVAQLNSIAPMIELIRQTGLAGIIAETAVHDRKSGVKGKSGLVRVDLGGCRISTKKNKGITAESIDNTQNKHEKGDAIKN